MGQVIYFSFAVLAFQIRIILTLPGEIQGKVLDVVKFVSILTEFG